VLFPGNVPYLCCIICIFFPPSFFPPLPFDITPFLLALLSWLFSPKGGRKTLGCHFPPTFSCDTGFSRRLSFHRQGFFPFYLSRSARISPPVLSFALPLLFLNLLFGPTSFLSFFPPPLLLTNFYCNTLRSLFLDFFILILLFFSPFLVFVEDVS